MQTGEPAFFQVPGGHGGVRHTTPDPRVVRAQLHTALKAIDENIAALARSGHSMVLTYPWTLYEAAIREANKSHG
jgi:hypothetical protein